jgi:hypothetical protein
LRSIIDETVAVAQSGVIAEITPRRRIHRAKGDPSIEGTVGDKPMRQRKCDASAKTNDFTRRRDYDAAEGNAPTKSPKSTRDACDIQQGLPMEMRRQEITPEIRQISKTN